MPVQQECAAFAWIRPVIIVCGCLQAFVPRGWANTKDGALGLHPSLGYFPGLLTSDNYGKLVLYKHPADSLCVCDSCL